MDEFLGHPEVPCDVGEIRNESLGAADENVALVQVGNELAQ